MRPLYEIALEIKKDWRKCSPYAKDHLDAMEHLSSIDDKYYADSARTIVSYFLSNASSWKGDVARRVKTELKEMLK